MCTMVIESRRKHVHYFVIILFYCFAEKHPLRLDGKNNSENSILRVVGQIWPIFLTFLSTIR